MKVRFVFMVYSLYLWYKTWTKVIATAGAVHPRRRQLWLGMQRVTSKLHRKHEQPTNQNGTNTRKKMQKWTPNLITKLEKHEQTNNHITSKQQIHTKLHQKWHQSPPLLSTLTWPEVFNWQAVPPVWPGLGVDRARNWVWDCFVTDAFHVSLTACLP